MAQGRAKFTGGTQAMNEPAVLEYDPDLRKQLVNAVNRSG